MQKKLVYLSLFFTCIHVIGQDTFTPPLPKDYYWVGDGGKWSDFENHWATTSGGSTFHVTAPTQYDNVFFDENSFFIKESFFSGSIFL